MSDYTQSKIHLGAVWVEVGADLKLRGFPLLPLKLPVLVHPLNNLWLTYKLSY